MQEYKGILRNMQLRGIPRSEAERRMSEAARVIPLEDALLARVLCDVPMFLSRHDDDVSASIAFHGYWEYPITEHLARWVIGFQLAHGAAARAAVVIDVGANVGWFSLVGHLLGARVLSVECNPECVELMQRTRAIVGAHEASWEIANVAASSHGQDLLLVLPKRYNRGSAWTEAAPEFKPLEPIHPQDSSGGHKQLMRQLMRDLWTPHGPAPAPALSRRVASARLDDLFDAMRIAEPVSVFLKLDIEGGEYDALMGAQRLMASPLVEHLQICVEWLKDRADPRLLDLLESFGPLAVLGVEGREYVVVTRAELEQIPHAMLSFDVR